MMPVAVCLTLTCALDANVQGMGTCPRLSTRSLDPKARALLLVAKAEQYLRVMTETDPKPRPSIFVFDVLLPMLFPVHASAGDVLVVEPGHPTRPIMVVRRSPAGYEELRVGPANFGALIVLWDEGVIVERSSASVMLFVHPTVEPSLRPSLALAL
jgi:hypothetical protein